MVHAGNILLTVADVAQAIEREGPNEAVVAQLDLRISPTSVEALGNTHCGPTPEGSRWEAGLAYGNYLFVRAPPSKTRDLCQHGGGEALLALGARFVFKPCAAQRASQFCNTIIPCFSWG